MATAAIKDIFVGDVGTRFICEIVNLVNSDPEAPLDISAATEKQVVFMDPAGVEHEHPGSFVSDGTDGLLQYVTAQKTDLHIDGTWEYYGWVKWPNGERRTSSVKFKVYPGRQSEQA